MGILINYRAESIHKVSDLRGFRPEERLWILSRQNKLPIMLLNHRVLNFSSLNYIRVKISLNIHVCTDSTDCAVKEIFDIRNFSLDLK